MRHGWQACRLCVALQERWHEFVVRLDKPVSAVMEAMADQGFQAGFDMTKDYPELGNALLVCVTETKEEDDLRRYEHALREAVC